MFIAAGATFCLFLKKQNKTLIFMFSWVCRGALSTELLSIRAPGGRSKGWDGGRGGGEGRMGASFPPIWFPLFIYLDSKKRAGLEEFRPTIRVRIDQCREKKKSYINIYYVGKSIDKSSLSRARALFLCFFPSSHPQPARATPDLRPPAKLSTASRATWGGPVWGAVGPRRGAGA